MPRRKRDAPVDDAAAIADPENTPDSRTDSGPELVSGGTYAIYKAPDGGFVLVVQDQTGEVQRRHIPGRLIRLLARGGLGKQLSAIFEGGTAANVDELTDELVSADADG